MEKIKDVLHLNKDKDDKDHKSDHAHDKDHKHSSDHAHDKDHAHKSADHKHSAHTTTHTTTTAHPTGSAHAGDIHTVDHPKPGVEHTHSEHHHEHADHSTHVVTDKTKIDKHHHTGEHHTEHAHVRHEGEHSRSVVKEAEHVQETVREVELHKVQPILHRDREQTEVVHVVEPHKVREVLPTEIVREADRSTDLGVRSEASTISTSRDLGHAPDFKDTTKHIGVTQQQHTELPTKIEETVHTKVVEHVHPVIYKETVVPRVREEVHHIHETVKEKPVETYEVREVVHHETRGGMSEKEFFDKFGHTGLSTAVDSTHVHSEHHRHGEHHDHHHGEHAHHTGPHKHEHGHTHTTTTTTTTHAHGAEPLVVHSQNIGAHQMPNALIGHSNTAYDKAISHHEHTTTVAHDPKDTHVHDKDHKHSDHKHSDHKH